MYHPKWDHRVWVDCQSYTFLFALHWLNSSSCTVFRDVHGRQHKVDLCRAIDYLRSQCEHKQWHKMEINNVTTIALGRAVVWRTFFQWCALSLLRCTGRPLYRTLTLLWRCGMLYPLLIPFYFALSLWLWPILSSPLSIDQYFPEVCYPLTWSTEDRLWGTLTPKPHPCPRGWNWVEILLHLGPTSLVCGHLQKCITDP